MREIDLDATTWVSILDFYCAIQDGIGAPEGTSGSIDGLIDSMVWGGMNAVDPPYVVRIHNLRAAPDDVREYVRSVQSHIAEGREYFRRQEEHDVEVSIDIAS